MYPHYIIGAMFGFIFASYLLRAFQAGGEIDDKIIACLHVFIIAMSFEICVSSIERAFNLNPKCPEINQQKEE